MYEKVNIDGINNGAKLTKNEWRMDKNIRTRAKENDDY